MIIRAIASTHSIALEDTANFKAFSLRVEGKFEDQAGQDELIGRVAVRHDHEHAWISEQFLREWPSLAGETWWQDGLTKMIAAVQKFGWIDEATRSIRAHIEYAP